MNRPGRSGLCANQTASYADLSHHAQSHSRALEEKVRSIPPSVRQRRFCYIVRLRGGLLSKTPAEFVPSVHGHEG